MHALGCFGWCTSQRPHSGDVHSFRTLSTSGFAVGNENIFSFQCRSDDERNLNFDLIPLFNFRFRDAHIRSFLIL